MTKEEIQALIDAKIAGQGSAVDLGGALPQILSGILDLGGGDTPTPVPVQKHVLAFSETGESLTEEQFLASLTLDGEPATFEALAACSPLDTVIYDQYSSSYLTISKFRVSALPKVINIYAGVYWGDYTQSALLLAFSGSSGDITYFDL